MFTFKKLALVGVAGLAAFAMSCSDSDSDDAAGSWSGFAASYDAANEVIKLDGTIKASEGVVSKLEATVDGTPVALKPSATFSAPNAAEVSLKTPTQSYIDKEDVCTAVPGAATVTVKVIATIGSSVVSSDGKSVAIACGTNVPPPTAYWSGVVLSFAGKSYADVDEKATLSQSEARETPEDVDLVAFAESGAANVIYGACDIFGADDCNLDVAIYETALTSVAAIKAAKQDIFDAGETVATGIAIVANKWFVLESSDYGEFAIQIKSTGTATVTFDVYEID